MALGWVDVDSSEMHSSEDEVYTTSTTEEPSKADENRDPEIFAIAGASNCAVIGEWGISLTLSQPSATIKRALNTSG